MRAVLEDGVERSPVRDIDALLAENARLEAQLDGLHRALQSRATIEQAKGVLIAIAQVSEAEAFDLLVQLSQRRNVRLRLLAEVLLQMTASGFETAGQDALHHWLREELVRLGQSARVPRNNPRPGRPRA